MNVKVLKDDNGSTFSPKVSAESVYRGGKSTTVETSLSGLEDSMQTIRETLGDGKDILVATAAEIQSLFAKTRA